MRKCVAATAVAATGLSGLVLGSGTATADSACPDTYVVAVPGTWETGVDKDDNVRGGGMLAGVTEGLPGTMRVDYVDYSATAFPWEGDVYGASEKEARDNARGLIADMAAHCGGTKYAIVGYSQGADAAGDVAAEIGTGHGVVPADKVVAVGLVSDPKRSPADTQVGPPVGGSGAEGARPGGFGQLTDRVRTVCAEGDLYCATEDTDYISRLAGFVAAVSGGNAADMWRYQLQAVNLASDLMSHGGIGALQSQLTGDANEQRVKQIEDFYGTGYHTSYGTYAVGGGQTAISWMHSFIAGAA
ncbi:cutinase family protein [Nocardia stercoris]|uniref:Cutinase family protein n=1 Tax=Nocardia stercoris TaxID=2483361 RepID=A0A3M2LCX8_9NOCA|nr:cutinase family protein [Nocardia stercoris]